MNSYFYGGCSNTREERKDRLQMQFDIKNVKHREKLLCEIVYYVMEIVYKDMRKFLHIPQEYITDGGYPLGIVWANLKEAYNQNQLSEEEIRFLLKLRIQYADSHQKDLQISL